jgi:hypothetical protein
MLLNGLGGGLLESCMNALGMRSDLRKRLNRRMDEVFLRAGHDAKNRKKTDRRMEFVFVATRRNSHEAVDVNVDPRQVRQGVEFRSSSGASWMAGKVRTRICLTGTRVAKAASTRAPPVVAVFARFKD